MTDEDLLIDREEFLKRGVHIGTKSQHSDMEDFVFHVKKNQLAVLDLNKTDEQIREASEFLAEFEPENVLFVGRKDEAREGITRVAGEIGSDYITGRFMPGTFTNPRSDSFREPDVIIVSDPEVDSQAVEEAQNTGVPVIGIVDSGNSLEGIEIPVPANNKSGDAISTVLHLIGKEYAALTGLDYSLELEDLAEVEDEQEEEEEDSE